jgi:hypothetical protein
VDVAAGDFSDNRTGIEIDRDEVDLTIKMGAGAAGCSVA